MLNLVENCWIILRWVFKKLLFFLFFLFSFFEFKCKELLYPFFHVWFGFIINMLAKTFVELCVLLCEINSEKSYYSLYHFYNRWIKWSDERFDCHQSYYDANFRLRSSKFYEMIEFIKKKIMFLSDKQLLILLKDSMSWLLVDVVNRNISRLLSSFVVLPRTNARVCRSLE